MVFAEVEYFDDRNAFTDVLAIFAYAQNRHYFLLPIRNLLSLSLSDIYIDSYNALKLWQFENFLVEFWPYFTKKLSRIWLSKC